MCRFPQTLQTVGKKTSFSPVLLVSGYCSIALGIRPLFCFWPIPLIALKYILSLKFLSNLVDYEERERGIYSKTQSLKQWDLSEIYYLNAKRRRVPACPSWLSLPAISDTRFLAFHPIHNSQVGLHPCRLLYSHCCLLYDMHKKPYFTRALPWIKCHIQATSFHKP